MDDTEMKFTEEHLNSSKTLKVIQQGPIATTSLIETTYGKKFIIKKYNTENAAEARAEYLFLQTSHTDYAVKAIGYLAMDNPVIILAYIEGKNLSNKTFKEWKDYEICLTRLAQTVSIFHARGICLNDIKPDNLIINDGLAYITDLGMATVNLFYERHFRGTPAFAAPEKFTRFSNSFASDIFSLGMVLFFCKHNQTVLDLVGNDEYQKLVVNEELWQKQLELLEDSEIILSMLNHNPSLRPRAIDIAIDLARRHKIALDAIDMTYIESYVFKSQHSAVEKLIKKKNLALDYSDEPQVIENMLSLWVESTGKKLLILDESLFVSQPEVFFKSFPFGYRDINAYQTHLIDWLLEQQITVLLRRNKQLNTTTFFDEIKIKTNAMQIWIGSDSEIKPVTNMEVGELMSRLPAGKIDQQSLKKRLNQLKPFYVRLLFMEMIKSKKHVLENNELTGLLSWIQVSLPLVLVEKLWENWYQLVQDGLLSRKIIIDNNIIWTDSRNSSPAIPDKDLVAKVIELSIKTGFNNIAGDIYFRIHEPDKAIEYWTHYLENLIKTEYFLSAYEFIRQLKKKVKSFPFELQKKEAFLARICGHFELSNTMYDKLISQSEGLVKAVLSVDQAIVLQALKRFDEAIGLYQNAIDLFRLHKDLKSLFRAMNNLGVVYFGLQRYTEAEQLFYDVLNEAKQQNNVQFEAISYLNLSDIQLKRGEWKRVLYYTDKAIPLTLGKQKWNLYANGNVIRARALFALGEFTEAIRILSELRDNPKINENLLQYQEILAWLMFFFGVCSQEKAYELADNTGVNEVSLHEILKRELFFTNLTRKRYLKADSYLQDVSETAIMKAFFDSDIDSIIEKLKDIRNQSEIDLYLYYLTQSILVLPEASFSKLTDEIQESVSLYTYKPVEYLTKKLHSEIQPNLFWAEVADKINSAEEYCELLEISLNVMCQSLRADQYIYFELQNSGFKPLAAIDAKGENIPLDRLLLSKTVLQYISGKEGSFYISPVPQYIESDGHSSILGLGVSTVSGFTVKRQGNIYGVFYCDSTEKLSLDDDKNAMFKILSGLVQSRSDVLFNKENRTGAADIPRPEVSESGYESIIGKNKLMLDVFNKISLVAGHNVNVLITGPTGSGKELVAREIHRRYNSSDEGRQKTPFIAVNCAAIPETLLESELFGYKKGAFTGAATDKKGKILLADNGTIFLDEIGEMPILLQSKLLRAIQERTITPLGSDQDIPVNVRIIAASNQNLEEMVAKNQFRADLFYRLKVMTIELPSLNERREDIPLLAMSFMRKFNDKFHKKVAGFHLEAMKYLQNREWKGNVRELENEIERALLLCNTEYLNLEDFSSEQDSTAGSIFRNLPINWQHFKDYKKRIEDELDKRYIKLLLDEADNNIVSASKIGNLDRMQIYRLLKKKKD
jgi:transcriptional regulator with PAS, ATPase and Fis domain/serine/threonine protein kinase